MCDKCKDIALRDRFHSPQDYLHCLEYVGRLIASSQFVMLEQTCPLNAVKDENGNWVDDVIYHKISCTDCGAIYTAFCNTYHGNGSFRMI